MKKSFLIALLILSFVVCPFGTADARKAKKPNPIKAPLVINEPEEQTETATEDVQEQTPVEEKKEEPVVEVKDIKNNIDIQEPSSEKNGDVVLVESVGEEKSLSTIDQVQINPCNSEIEGFFKNFFEFQNKHNINALKKLYTDDFLNTDGYNKTQLFALMTRTYAGYPDMKTSYEVKEIFSNETYATAAVIQKISATTKDSSKITKDKGVYTAELENIFYLKKFGKEWKIYSENVVRENSVLAYGMAKEVGAQIIAPQKVHSNSDYSAGIKVYTPEGYSAIASINNTQIVEGYNMKGETFRQVSDNTPIERVLKANELNNNEAVVVSVGFTKLTQDMFKKAKLDIAGLMILMQRVDIIPVNTNNEVTKVKNETKTK